MKKDCFASLAMTQNLMMPKGQSIIEFTFGMIVVVFLIYGMVRIFLWTGMDLASRRMANDNSLTAIPKNGPNQLGNVSDQLNPDFYRVVPIDAVYNGSITNEGP